MRFAGKPLEAALVLLKLPCEKGGPVRRLAEQRPGSDINLLLEFIRPIGLFKFVEMENRLTEILGAKVDLVTRNALKPHIGRRILDEVRYVS